MFHRSERLFLRPPFADDAHELTAAIADKAIVRHLARVPWPYTVDDARAWMSAPRDPRLPSLLVTLPGEAAPIIGGCGLHEGKDGPEIGYWIARRYWGRGMATEAARSLLAIAHALGHRRLVARHASDNPGSARVLRKAGFVPTGRTGRFFSLGRGEEVEAPELAIDLDADMPGASLQVA